MALANLPTARRIAAETGPGSGPIEDFATGTGQVADADLQPLYLALDEHSYVVQTPEAVRALYRAKDYVESEMRTRGLWPGGW